MSVVVDRDEAVQLLASGAVVALPTDTVYGLAASLAHPDAIGQLFAMKRRPDSVALPILADSLASITSLGVTWTANASRLSDAFWPGALTVVVAVSFELGERVGSSNGTVGFRVPGDDALRELLVATGPLAVSSANEHGRAPLHNADDVRRTFVGIGALKGVLDGGRRAGEVSTVVSVVDAAWSVLRQGSISVEDVTNVLGP